MKREMSGKVKQNFQYSLEVLEGSEYSGNRKNTANQKFIGSEIKPIKLFTSVSDDEWTETENIGYLISQDNQYFIMIVVTIETDSNGRHNSWEGYKLDCIPSGKGIFRWEIPGNNEDYVK